ncbi:craniofacial development protein 1 [Achroia grisella]|uniref:craniofacial development protein 1 n=1 Tax=Achroia grisella TaxID=688607 RepID=UPI0027D24EC3|nr:craniofacial development protein 1 [Achroia grisella]
MSSGSESDEDYIPGEVEQVSEEGSADEETDLQYEQELEYKTKKRKASKQCNEIKKKKIKSRNDIKKLEAVTEVNVEVTEEAVDPEEQKKHEDDLWAKFLDGTDTKPKPTCQPTKTNANSIVDNAVKQPSGSFKGSNDDEKARERRIFEFAGETIVVENNVIKEKINSAESPAAASKLDGPSSRGRPSGGLSGLLNNLNKTAKLSTLEKSKLDWLTYKKEEGIEEEIESHNKGKAGYLDRQDFLERADLRQYEIERDLRMSRRSKR